MPEHVRRFLFHLLGATAAFLPALALAWFVDFLFNFEERLSPFYFHRWFTFVVLAAMYGRHRLYPNFYPDRCKKCIEWFNNRFNSPVPQQPTSTPPPKPAEEPVKEQPPKAFSNELTQLEKLYESCMFLIKDSPLKAKCRIDIGSVDEVKDGEFTSYYWAPANVILFYEPFLLKADYSALINSMKREIAHAWLYQHHGLTYDSPNCHGKEWLHITKKLNLAEGTPYV